MSTDYNYDEQGQFFPFFVATITALFTVPITYSLLKPSKELENTAPRIQSDFKPDQAELIEKQRWKQKRRERKLKRMILAGTGWLVMALMAYLIVVTERTGEALYNPWEILDIARGANEKQIKAHYRKLSLTMHPDKVRLDPDNNITAESVTDRWVKIGDAFKALATEEGRRNWELYGHPEGKQSFSIGIALPKYIVEEGNGKFVLLIYGALLGIILPYFVGKWWYGTQKMTRDKVLVSSAGKLFTEYNDEISTGGILGVLSKGDEYEEFQGGNKSEYGLAKLERTLFACTDVPLTAAMSADDRSKIESTSETLHRKVLALLWAYAGRLDLGDDVLNEEKFEVAPIAVSLNEAFSSISLAFGNTKPLLRSWHLTQCLIQGMPPLSSPLLQLPHFTSAVVKAVEDKTRKTMSINDFMDLPDAARRKLAVAPNILSEAEYKSAVSVSTQIPAMRLEKAWFKVTGEKHILPSSLVQFVVKVRFIPPGTLNVPEITEPELEDLDPVEGDLDALHGKAMRKIITKDGETIYVPQNAEVAPPLAHAPYYARDHPPTWRLFLSEHKSGKVAVPPFTFNTFERPIFEEDGRPTFNVQTMKMQFQAPPSVGEYLFTMHLVCDSYVGFDIEKDVVLAIEEPSAAETIEEEDEISEPEEDSLAGQMSALKGNPAPRPKRSKKVDEEDEDDDSDTEGDEDSALETDTDTDTDTDEE